LSDDVTAAYARCWRRGGEQWSAADPTAISGMPSSYSHATVVKLAIWKEISSLGSQRVVAGTSATMADDTASSGTAWSAVAEEVLDV
jgi:hypothetical protein